jgi:hypothetical protein
MVLASGSSKQRHQVAGSVAAARARERKKGGLTSGPFLNLKIHLRTQSVVN